MSGELFETKYACPPVESFIWELIGFNYYDFAGVKELSFSDLLTLRSLIDHQLNLLTNTKENKPLTKEE